MCACVCVWELSCFVLPVGKEVNCVICWESANFCVCVGKVFISFAWSVVKYYAVLCYLFVEK